MSNALKLRVILLCGCLLVVMFFAGPGRAMAQETPARRASEPMLEPASDQQQAGFVLVEEGLSLGAGAFVGQSPYKHTGLNWMPLPLVGYEGRYVYLRGLSAGLKLMNGHAFEFSVFAEYDGTSFHTSDTRNAQLKRLKNRQGSMMTGVAGRVMTPAGLIEANLGGDVLGHSNGLKGDVAYGIATAHGPLELVGMVGVSWKSRKYNDYYYGVSAEESRDSGLDAHTARSGLAPYVELTASLSLTERFEMFCTGEIEFLDREVRQSPMVGKSQLLGVSGGVQYNF